MVVTDYDAAIELFVQNGDACSSRGVNHYFNNMCRGGTYGLVLTSGNLWTEQRKFALRVLRDFGMGSNLMQEKVITLTWQQLTNFFDSRFFPKSKRSSSAFNHTLKMEQMLIRCVTLTWQLVQSFTTFFLAMDSTM